MSRVEKIRREREQEAFRQEELERKERRKYYDQIRTRLRREEERIRMDKQMALQQQEKKNKEIAEIEKKSQEYLEEIENKKKKNKS
jgi:hypothetical protein